MLKAAVSTAVNHLSPTTTKLNFPSKHPNFPRTLHFPPPTSSKSSLISIPPKPPVSPSPPPPADDHNPYTITEFQDKLLYLDSLGIDIFYLLNSHPTLISITLPDLKSTVSFLYSVGLTASDLRRAVSMYPQIFTSPLRNVISVITFLLREAHVPTQHLRRVIHRRPRLLICNVKTQLRPTLYFLQGTIGIADISRYTHLLSCSVEDKFMPRIDYFQNLGFSYRETISMFRRFPALFCYSVKENLEPKYNYFVVEMGRDMKELKEFPQYFSCSLENRIKPRHTQCVEKGVCLTLPRLLVSGDHRFLQRLEGCRNSSVPDQICVGPGTECFRRQWVGGGVLRAFVILSIKNQNPVNNYASWILVITLWTGGQAKNFWAWEEKLYLSK